MLTDEDIEALKAMIANLLETYGLKKPPSSAALRQQRYRERKQASVTGHNKTVTGSGLERNAPSQKRNARVNGHRIAFDWEAFMFTGITAEDMKRWQEAYPALPVPDLVDRAAIWLKANPKNRKSNYERFLTNWLVRAQDRAGRSA